MIKTQIIALSSFSGSHILSAVVLFMKNENNEFPYQIIIISILGLISVISNVLFAETLAIKKWLLIVFTISSSVWIIPILLFTYFGIPFFFIYLIIGIYIHIKGLKVLY